MIYKTATELYFELVRDKNLYIPRLNYADEVSFNMLNFEIDRVAEVLNHSSRFEQFLSFNLRRDYKLLTNELREFFKFWGFEKDKEIHIDKIMTKEWQ